MGENFPTLSGFSNNYFLRDFLSSPIVVTPQQPNIDDILKNTLVDLYKTKIDFYKTQKNMNSGIYGKYIVPALGIVQGLSTLGSLWLGFQNYKLAKNQLGIAREQWDKTKEELARIKTLREELTRRYMGE